MFDTVSVGLFVETTNTMSSDGVTERSLLLVVVQAISLSVRVVILSPSFGVELVSLSVVDRMYSLTVVVEIVSLNVVMEIVSPTSVVDIVSLTVVAVGIIELSVVVTIFVLLDVRKVFCITGPRVVMDSWLISSSVNVSRSLAISVVASSPDTETFLLSVVGPRVSRIFSLPVAEGISVVTVVV